MSLLILLIAVSAFDFMLSIENLKWCRRYRYLTAFDVSTVSLFEQSYNSRFVGDACKIFTSDGNLWIDFNES